MTLRLTASVLASGEGGEHAEATMTVSPWAFGISAMAAFLILLFVVTRLNLDR